MQQLHLVGFTRELDGLIFSALKGSTSGGYVVALDDRLVSLIRESVRLQTGIDPGSDPERGGAKMRGRTTSDITDVESALTLTQIQAYLRAGRGLSDVAGEAGVSEEWVERLAAPVRAEQHQAVARAILLPCRTQRKGESAEPLGVSVNWTLTDRGLRFTPDERAACWSSYHVRDSVWVIRFSYLSRGREQMAQWEYDNEARTLIALNRLASDLGYVRPGRRRRLPSTREAIAAEQVGPRATPTPPTPAPEPPAEPPPVVISVAKGAVPTRPNRKKTPAKRAPAKRAPAKRAPAKRPTRKRAPVKKATSKRAPAKRAAPKHPAPKRAAPQRRPPPLVELIGADARRSDFVRARPLPARSLAARPQPPGDGGRNGSQRRQRPLLARRMSAAVPKPPVPTEPTEPSEPSEPTGPREQIEQRKTAVVIGAPRAGA